MAGVTSSLWDSASRLRLLAGAAVLAGFVAMGESGFNLLDSLLLPVAAAAFVAKAVLPRLPSLVVAVPALVVPITINIANDTDVEFSMFLLVLAVVLVASIEPDRRISTGFPVIATVVVFTLTVTDVLGWAWANWVSALLLSWAFGAAVFHYDRLLIELRATQAELIDQAKALERRKIARDVHDLVGHSLTVVMLHVAGARRVLRSDPDEAETALLQAEEAGRASMAEVRQTVGLLRTEEEGADATPTPDLRDLATVVEQYREAGMTIDFQTEGPIDRVAGPEAVACHRIAQEALANAAKHAQGALVDVDVSVDADQCRLTVRSRGGQPLEPGRPDRVGHGLVGMRERAMSVGASLQVGPTRDGWAVDVLVPLDVTS